MGGRGASFGGGGAQPLKSGSGGIHPIDITKKPWAGMTLERGEGHIRSRKMEVLLVYDRNNKLIAGFQGGKHSVGFPASLLAQKGITVTHNHPQGVTEARFGGTLSFTDVRNMAASKWKEHRATAGGQGELNYIIRPSKSKPTRGKALLKRIDKDQPKLQKLLNKTYNATRRAEIKSGKSKEHAEHVARQKAVGEIHRYWKDILPKYGYDYVTPKKEYPYQR